MYRFRHIDCALFSLPSVDSSVCPALSSELLRPIVVHPWPLANGQWNGDSRARPFYETTASGVLERASASLLRFDVCLLPVIPDSLAWTRAALAACHDALPIPLVLLACDLTAPALRDLVGLGATDFVLPQAGPEELKARLTQAAAAGVERRSAFALAQSLAEPEAAGAYGAPGRPPVEASQSELTTRIKLDDAAGYRAIRAQVLADFERDYVVGMLVRYRGNVTHAARAGKQDRRAFWHLMRKYQIVSAEFRRDPQGINAPCR